MFERFSIQRKQCERGNFSTRLSPQYVRMDDVGYSIAEIRITNEKTRRSAQETHPQ
jgi:hypothetical protein